MAFTKEVLDAILKDYHGPEDFYGPEGIMKQLTKALAERTMEADLTEHLGYEKHDLGAKPAANRRSGKELRTDSGPMEIAVPRDREGTYEPQIAPKHQREFRGFDGKILSVYALGLTARQIQDRLKEIYAVDESPELLSRAADAVKGSAAEWRGRPLEPFYPVLFPDALRVNIREGAAAVKKSVYLALAIRLDGQKGHGETKVRTGCGLSKTKEPSNLWFAFWTGILNELKNRGVKDIPLTGWPVFPMTPPPCSPKRKCGCACGL
jgi:transposase-like protein